MPGSAIGRDGESACEMDEHGSRRLGAVGLVVPDHPLADPDGVPEFGLTQVPRLPALGEAGPEALQGPLLHAALPPPRRLHDRPSSAPGAGVVEGKQGAVQVHPNLGVLLQGLRRSRRVAAKA